jgi:trehalose 6-phosphate phosphatase
VASIPQPPAIALATTALLLDIDGTLLDIVPRPEDVVVPETLKDALSRLQHLSGGALALISGRPLAQIDQLFSPLRLPAVGTHGAELRIDPLQAATASPPLPAGLRQALAKLATGNVRFEDKTASAALHYRQAPEQEQALLEGASKILRTFPGFELLRGKAIVEIKSKAFDKGTAFAAIMQAAPFAGRTPLFIGDDTTDEAIFARLAAFRGIGISVGKTMTGAAYSLPSPAAVRLWLEMQAKNDGTLR